MAPAGLIHAGKVPFTRVPGASNVVKVPSRIFTMKKPFRAAAVESHPSTNEGWGARLLGNSQLAGCSSKQ